MSFGGPNNPYQPWPPNGGPPANPGPYVPPQPYPNPYPYVPQPQPYRSRWGMLRNLRGGEWPPLRVLLRDGRPRIPGHVWAVVLFPCTWSLVLPLMVGYVFARSARLRAHRLFPPHGHRVVDDPQVWRVQKARAWTAAVMSLLLLVVYGKPGDYGDAQDQYLTRLLVTPPLLLVSAPLVIAVLFRWASPQAKERMRPRLRAAGKAALWYVGAVTAVPLVFVAFTMAQRSVPAAIESVSQVPWIPLLLCVPLFWLLFFLGFATGPAVRSGFNCANVHPALPALLTGALVWEFALISLAAGGTPPGPPLVQIGALLGGPASVTAVAWWEISRLRTRHGVALRG
ncbi:hypothetical protein [Streptomyces sp. GESEQ-35]|uniref:hypothetical protein n=1 Tax=Streptomyces sp. GESEQ-35 TaxID=2812657 RepID=UPI0027E2CC10|nr:hypothetical protein [Streptomyces sp. GESEQ-35]